MLRFAIAIAIVAVFYGTDFTLGMPGNGTMAGNSSMGNDSMGPMGPMGNMSMKMGNMSMGGPGISPGGGKFGPPPKIGGISFDKGGMKMKDLKNLKVGDLSSAVGSLSNDEKDTMCQSIMNGGADKTQMAKVKGAGLDCVASMKRDPSFKPKGGQAFLMVEQMKESASPKSWGKEDWALVFKSMPDAIKGEDIRKMSGDTMKQLVKSGDIDASAMKKPSERRAVEAQLKSAYGDPSTWDDSALSEMGSLVGTMDKSSLRKIPPAQMKKAASTFKDMKFDDPGQKAALGKQLIDGLGADASAWTSDDIKNSFQFIASKPSIMGKLSDAALKSSLSDLGARKTDKRGAAQLGQRLKAMNEYKDPTAIDSSKIETMGSLMKGMGRDYLSKLPADSIKNAIGTLANVTFPRGEARQMMAKIKGSVSSYSASNLTELGHLVTGLDPADLDQIPADALAGSIAMLADKDFDKGQCRAIVKKIKSAGSENLKNMGALMNKCMTPDDLDSASIDDLGLNCSDSTPPTFSPDKATAKTLFKKIRARFGSPNSTNTQYSLQCIKNWGPVAALGMDAEDFENLPDNGDIASVFEELSAFEDDMDETQTKAIAKRIKTHLQMNDTAAAEAHSASTIAQVGKFLKHFSDEELDKFNSSVKPDIVTELSEANMDKMPPTEMLRLKKFSMKNVKKDDGTIEDKTSAASLSEADIASLGNMFGGVETSDINKMTSDAISSNLDAMNKMIRGKAKQQAVLDRAISEDSTFLDSADNIIGSAGLIGGLSSTNLGNLNATVLGEALADAASIMESRKEQDDKRDNAGFKDEVSSTDKSAMDENKKQFVLKSFEGYLASKSTSSSRRRRATTTITCADITTLGSNAVSLTSAQLETLSTSDFTDCTETLGAITGWSSEQITTLTSEAKAAYGSTVSSWSSSNVKLLGTINAGLTTAEIGTLAITSADILTVMGTSPLLTSAQLKAGFSRFLSQAKSSTASSVTGDELISLGAFACGAETSEISTFTSANYKTAATTIGQQTKCDASQLSSYATLAKSAYGAISTWDSTVIASVGAVIGGLSAAEIGTLTEAQIAQITPATIATIPSSSLVGFSTTQIGYFSSSQANAVTSTQQLALSSAQLTALTGAGATVKVVAQSSAGTVKATFLMLLPLLALLF